ncbi:hypothetical protein BDD12DRAFT_807657 [Trichophaea hybrida]|nr:hypothetical protein BDD12DRAFT_807657 [Trichophaea hybrida]
MSATTSPITPEAFQLAIADLELEQLHVESARLHNSIYHLERSNIALEEFKDDEDCRIAIGENVATIERQRERIEMIRVEVEKRGFMMTCGKRKEEATAATTCGAPEANGNAGGDSEAGRNQQNSTESGGGDEEEGVYL